MRSTETARVDLHAHSTASDGMLSPAELVARAAARGVAMLALTDHDTTAGLEQAQCAAADSGVTLVPGIEMSTAAAGKPLHVVGLGIDPSAPVLQRSIEALKSIREQRARGIGCRLDKLGIVGAYEGACQESGSPYPGRAHFARWLLRRGVFSDHSEVFDRLLGRGKPGYVATQWPELEDTVACIVAAGGVAVLAHPLRYKLTGSWLRRIAATFKDAGGAAIEVVVANQRAQETAFAADVARRAGLAGSMGSDFHSPGAHAAELGGFGALPAGIEPIYEHFREHFREHFPAVSG